MGCHYRQNSAIVTFVNGASNFVYGCLLYTSDAADEEDSVDLGGRRIIKKIIIKKMGAPFTKLKAPFMKTKAP